MVQIYRQKWNQDFFRSLWCYLRDSVVFWLPMRKLPQRLIKILYGEEIRFAFFVHPRTYQDIFIPLPFLAWLKLIFRREQAYNLFSSLNPFILNQVDTPHNVRGLVVAQPTLPEVMFKKRKETLQHLKKMIGFIGKISCSNAVIGLGGWFPMVSSRGNALVETAKKHNLIITNGHCGTLASIYLTVEKIAGIGKMDLSELALAVIGVGKMGTNVARVFNGKVKKITLIDINEASVRKTRELLKASRQDTEIDIFLMNQDERSLRDVLGMHHVGVCATSTFRNLLKLKDMPSGFIAIDDSRPEALPRDPKNERIVLEGGLLKIHGAKIDYDYGFGKDDNVFGCLGEAFILALSRGTIEATLGEVDFKNFFCFLKFCKENNVSAGDFKSAETYVSENEIYEALEKRKKVIGV